MANINAKIDQNYDKVPLVVTDEVSAFTRPLLCEPVLDYLEIDLSIATSFNDVAVTAKEDQNFEYVQLATEQITELPKPLKVQPTNGRLIIDLV